MDHLCFVHLWVDGVKTSIFAPNAFYTWYAKLVWETSGKKYTPDPAKGSWDLALHKSYPGTLDMTQSCVMKVYETSKGLTAHNSQGMILISQEVMYES